MKLTVSQLRLLVLQNVPVLLLVAVFVIFGFRAPRFLQAGNIINIVVQASSLGIVAAGMTFVLLTAGIDLSVGSIMFLTAAVAGKIALGGAPFGVAVTAVILLGLLCGALNSLLITAFKLLPFIVTLATLFMGRGLALQVTQTRAMNLPDNFLRLGSAKVLGVPFPVLVLAAVVLVGQAVLSLTAYGRQLYAVGHDREAALKAGLRPRRLIASVYVISGLCAALGGLVAVSQLGAVSPTFGTGREFTAIAAAVLGGTSLFGGRGKIFPGAVLGAFLMQTIESGLVMINSDPYLYPVVTAGVIFLAVLLDSLKHQQLMKFARRKIRVDG